MKRILFTLILLLAATSLPAQNRELSRTKQEIETDMASLVSEALKQGSSKQGSYTAYTINNKKKKSVDASDAISYLRKNGYIPINAANKTILRYGAQREVLDYVSFIAASNFREYALETSPYDFSKATRNAIVFLPAIRESWYWGRDIVDKILTYNGVFWTGEVVDGYINGEGCGLVPFDGGYASFKGRFVAGFPTDGISNFQVLHTDLSKENKVIHPIVYWDIVRAKKEASGVLLAAMKQFARITYEENAGKVVDEYQRSFVINRNYNDFEPDKDVIDEFRILYGDWPQLDLQGVLGLTDDLLNVYTVWDALHFTFRKWYVSGLFSLRWNSDAVGDDLKKISDGLRVAEEKGKDSQFAFRPFCVAALPALKSRSKELDKHIDDQRAEYAAYLKRKEREEAEMKVWKAQMCEKCKIDGSKTTVPQGYAEGWDFLFFSTPAKSAEDGVIVMKNGDKIKWKYVWGDYSQWIEAEGSSFLVYDHFDSVDELFKAIVERCKNYYCR